MEVIVPNTDYTFDASAQEITLSTPFDVIDREQVLRIVNLTTRVVIYDSERRTHSIAVAAGVITHTYDLTGMADADILQITVDDGTSTSGTISVAGLNITENDTWISESNYAGTDNINMIKVNVDDEVDTGATFNTGQPEATEDSGPITAMDMPVSATPTAGDEMSYTYKIDGDNILTIYAEADSAGGIQNPGIVAHYQINMKEMTTPTAVANQGALYCKADNHLYFQDGSGVEHQVV